MRAVDLGETFYFAFGSRAFATGIPTIMAGTPVLEAIEMDSATGDELSGLTHAAHDVHTAVNVVTVVATTGNGYEAGKVYSVVVDTGTVGGVSVVGEVVYEFRIRTAYETAINLLQSYAYPAAALTTQTGVSDNTAMNLTGIVDGDSQDDLYNGWWGILRDADGQMYPFRITDFANTNLLASISAFDAGVTLPTPASGDNVWLMGLDPQYGGGLNLTEAGGDGDHLTEAGGDGDHLTALALASVLGALDDAAAAGDPTTADTVMQYLKQIVNLLAGAAGIGTNPSAATPANGVNLFEVLNSLSDRLPAALNNGVMPADVQRVNDVALGGDGTSGTEWGPA